MVVAATPKFGENFPGFSGEIIYLADGAIGNGLANSGDRLILKDATGQIIDAMSYGDDSSVLNPAPRAPASGYSLERQVISKRVAFPGDFAENANPSPGSPAPVRYKAFLPIAVKLR